jgi:uncharacterized membrane protein YedE/YeeE
VSSTTSAVTTSTTTAPTARQPAPSLGRGPQFGIIAVGTVLAGLLLVGTALAGGARIAVTAALGLALGLVLFHSRFGFTSAWRQLVAVGQGHALRAQMLMLAVATVLFAPILATGVGLFGSSATGYVSPLGTSVVLGAFLFAVGMQIGGACASGALYTVGSGHSAIVLTLGGFVVGSVLATWPFTFLTQTLPTGPSVSLAQSRLGYGGAVVVQLGVLAVIVGVSLLVQRRRTPPPVAAVATARGALRVVRGSWPVWVGAIGLAVLNAAWLLVNGKPWGITSAFALWGARIARAVGIPVQSWDYWRTPANAKALASPVLADATSASDLGIIIGALLAAGAAGTFLLHRRIPARIALGAVLGGIAMGFGARIAYGCNIGAYFGGIASFSLHGWLWAGAALVGTIVGLRLRPLLGLAVPKPSDSSC